MDDSHENPGFRDWLMTSALASANAPYLEELYDAFLRGSESVDPVWRQFFENLPRINGAEVDMPHAAIREHFRGPTRGQPLAPALPAAPVLPADYREKQVRVLQLINAYRFRGHQCARLDPLEMTPMPDVPELYPAHHGLTEADMETEFDTGSLVGPGKARLRDILDVLQRTYCRAVGAEYMYITDTAEKRWIQHRLESAQGAVTFSGEVRQRLFDRVTAAEGLEHFLHTKYVGQKRFSLEGAESLIPLLDGLVQRGGGHGIREIVIGMAHRGRLNVLVNIMGKTPAELFEEFEGRAHGNVDRSGDVKYHLGFSSNISTPAGPVHLALAFNPSHLEIVDPVVEGSVRARQDRRNDHDGTQVVPILIHGDAAFSGQGVVMETFNMSQSRSFTTRGTVHIVVNNQIGFTTSARRDARSTWYSTDVAKMVGAPIFHVNGDDPEAVLFVGQIALDYRMTFRKDVVIDIVCYRRHGHSEADEPSVTQPLMYRKIREMPSTRALYARRLVDEGFMGPDLPQQSAESYRVALESGARVTLDFIPDEEARYPYASNWKPFIGQGCQSGADTGVAMQMLRDLSSRLGKIPDGFELHPNVMKIYDNRRRMAAGAMPVDWGYAETLAYATLLVQGHSVRLSGQDSARGTFFHRHAAVYSVRDGSAYVPLAHLEGGTSFAVINSPLSEEAVLAFEYGYATTDPETLVIWEAQFGDFVNNAQVVVDQFISGGEQKWGRLCGLTLFLPHGYEGQGPEHSSGRPERYLQLAAQQNLQICIPTTPGQMFHLLRRQMLQACRKPLIVMTPKSLLRHRLATSSIDELCTGSFRTVLPESDPLVPAEVRRVVLCSGKVYYDLLERRREQKRGDTAILRMEQLYPFPEERLKEELARYSGASTVVWCQEEPRNQGAWYASQHHVRNVMPPHMQLEYAGRAASAAPAAGYPQLHMQQQRALVAEALGDGTQTGRLSGGGAPAV
ncbi:MAG: 2-oxoglutarate dehydrogenase E1 component [Pseudomonadota bacterium]|nr:2-oxoglutarate dehydrogenase E1 component [Pseudomonadota bacterium]